MQPWIYNPAVDPLDYFGFVYELHNTKNNRRYIGQKKFWTFKAKKIFKENDWQSYLGSNKELLEEITTGKFKASDYTRTILQFCVSAGHMNYEEQKQLFLSDALVAKLPNGEYAFYNANIACQHNRPHVEGYTDPDRRSKWLKSIANQKKKAGITKEKQNASDS